jgi:hypothetical protein
MSAARTIAGVTAAVALGVAGVSGPAQAAHDRNPSPKVASYGYGLDAVQPTEVPGSRASGTTRVTALPNGKVQVKVEARGLSPNLPHAMHLHGVAGAADDQGCPGPAQAGADGVVTVVDGIPFYGGILASLTTTGDTTAASALALDRFPVADADGNLSYSRTFRNADAYAEAGSVQVVVHGIDVDGSGTYAFDESDPYASRGSSLDPSIPLEVTVPVLCGGIAN